MFNTLILTLLLAAQPAFSEPPAQHRAQQRQPIAAQAEGNALRFIQQRDPIFYAELMALKDDAPKAYQRIVRRVSRSLQSGRHTPDQIARGLQVTKLELELRQKSRGFSDLTRAEQRESRAQMLPLAEQLFDLKQAARRERADELELRLQDLKAEIEEKEHEKAQLAEQYVDYLILGKPSL